MLRYAKLSAHDSRCGRGFPDSNRVSILDEKAANGWRRRRACARDGCGEDRGGSGLDLLLRLRACTALGCARSNVEGAFRKLARPLWRPVRAARVLSEACEGIDNRHQGTVDSDWRRVGVSSLKRRSRNTQGMSMPVGCGKEKSWVQAMFSRPGGHKDCCRPRAFQVYTRIAHGQLRSYLFGYRRYVYGRRCAPARSASSYPVPQRSSSWRHRNVVLNSTSRACRSTCVCK